ncbi:MAG: SGNH/GDSL hydrolase family protein [Cyanobacteriota bacterium]|nr:SGNH/GDSL hydrolase family protein [Cyanobacteriota bacterium]
MDTLFVFGDSYADAGNSGLLTKGIPPYLFGFPPAPYAGGRASNGPVAVEGLWSRFNPTAPPLKPSLDGGTNYAVNGATTGTDSQFAVDDNPAVAPVRAAFQNTSAFSQLQAFLNPAKTFQPDQTLFVFWLGANDGLYWLKTQTAPGIGSTPGTISGGSPSSGKTSSQLLDNALNNIESGLQTLIDSGASHIMVPNLLDLSLTPFYSNNPTLAASVHSLVLGFNAGLSTKISSLRTANPQVDLMAFDTFDLFHRIRSQPASFGLSNVSDRCVVNGVQVPACNPDQWFFWDGNHPTAKGHDLIAQAMFAQVPGPLPLAGAVAAFRGSRLLRRRLKAARAQTPRTLAPDHC